MHLLLLPGGLRVQRLNHQEPEPAGASHRGRAHRPRHEGKQQPLLIAWNQLPLINTQTPESDQTSGSPTQNQLLFQNGAHWSGQKPTSLDGLWWLFLLASGSKFEETISQSR